MTLTGRPARARRVETSQPVDPAQLGLWMFLATVTMLFAGFTSAYLVRQATGSDWRAIPLPRTLWLNTALLLLSSLALERGRARLRTGRGAGLKTWLVAAAALAGAFVAGQVTVWRQLAAGGFALPSDPHSAFFYILTGAHALHLAAGIVALLYVVQSAWRASAPWRLARRLELCATYWHFMAGLWAYLFVLLYVVS